MEEKEVDLRDYIRVIKKRKKIILLVFFVAIIVSAVVNFVLSPVYQAKSTIKIGQIIDITTLEKEPIESAIAASQFLQGPQILAEAIRDLNLPLTLKQMKKKVLVEPLRDTEDLIEVKAEAKASHQALVIANYLVDRLLERHQGIKSLYEDKDEILARYDEQIKGINEELAEIDKNKKEIMAGYDERIQGIDRQLAQLRNDITEMQKQIENKMEEPGSISEAEANILVSYQQRYDALMKELREAKLEKTEFEKGKQERYDTLTRELREAQMKRTTLARTDSLKMYNTEVLVPAKEPREPVKPKKLLNIMIAALVSLMAGLALAFSLEYFQKAS